jgi:hypothetical protein
MQLILPAETVDGNSYLYESRSNPSETYTDYSLPTD